jgi:hypothetical protein
MILAVWAGAPCAAYSRDADITFVGIHAVEQDSRRQLRADFLSSADLRKLAKSYPAISLHAYFCAHKKDNVLLGGPTVYFAGLPLYNHASDQSVLNPVYSFFISISGSESPDSTPKEFGFNLQLAPEDICFHLTGNYFFQRPIKTNVATVPKAAIERALNEPNPASPRFQ